MTVRVTRKSGLLAAAAAMLVIGLPAAGRAQVAGFGNMPEAFVPMPVLARFAVPAPNLPWADSLGFAPVIAPAPAGIPALRTRPAERHLLRELPSQWIWDLASRG